MPEIDYAFLADAAQATPGQKFNVLGGGLDHIGGQTYPLRHPHLALVIGLRVAATELDRAHELRFVLLDPDGREVAAASSNLTVRGRTDARDRPVTLAIDAWNLTFPAPGDYSFRLLLNGNERRRIPLVLVKLPATDAPTATEGPIN
ncbi:MAG: hypothetical protein L0221_02305 [Chloroflexi bacterium]|nr:hypothetical protein [Chloroflexota bacterium]